ncbi:tyrosine-type recombinase/integrase [Enterococcus sp. DIV0187]|uniref:tyrosine-type recombinase/integrase n=1 Tax=Enterococcus sp. DIV0187 TaxID=2774644 RepID=UPI003F1EA344
MASIKKQKNGTYTVQVSAGKNPVTGKYAIAKRRSIKTKKEATLIAAEIERQVAAGEYWQNSKKENLTYKDAYEIWIEKFEQTREPATTKKVKGMYKNHFLPKFGHMKLDEITPFMINDYSVELSRRFVCCDLMFRRFVEPFYLAHKLEMITKNPAKNVDTPRKKAGSERSKIDDFYEEEELDLFLKISKQLAEKNYKRNYKQYAFHVLLALSGARSQEVRAQMWKDLNFKSETMYIHRAVTTSEKGEYIAERTKNKSSTRHISIDAETLNVMEKWREIQQSRYPNWNENWLIFTNNRDTDGTRFLSTTGIRKWRVRIQDLMDKEAGEKLKRIDGHGFRHTHISLLVQNGVTLKAVADRVGHVDTSMVGKIYAHTTKRSEDQLRGALTTLLPSFRSNDKDDENL